MSTIKRHFDGRDVMMRRLVKAIGGSVQLKCDDTR